MTASCVSNGGTQGDSVWDPGGWCFESRGMVFWIQLGSRLDNVLTNWLSLENSLKSKIYSFEIGKLY